MIKTDSQHILAMTQLNELLDEVIILENNGITEGVDELNIKIEELSSSIEEYEKNRWRI